MRLFRFQAQLGFAVEPSALAAVGEHHKGLQSTSRERITAEFNKLLKGHYAKKALDSIAKVQVQRWIVGRGLSRAFKQLLEMNSSVWNSLEGDMKTLGFYATMLHEEVRSGGDQSEELFSNIILPNKEQLAILRIVKLYESAITPQPDIAGRLLLIEALNKGFKSDLLYTLAKPVWTDWTNGNEKLSKPIAALEQSEAKHGYRRRQRSPINGHLVQKILGVAPSKDLGEIVKAGRRAFLNGVFYH